MCITCRRLQGLLYYFRKNGQPHITIDLVERLRRPRLRS
jgi:hypothetical protein